MTTDTKHETKKTASAHTPGAWKPHHTPQHHSGNPDLYEIHWSDEGECVAEVVHGEANARLIAAAPKMLEALEYMIAWAELHGLTKAELITGEYGEVPVIGIARAAVAEAKGPAV